MEPLTLIIVIGIIVGPIMTKKVEPKETAKVEVVQTVQK